MYLPLEGVHRFLDLGGEGNHIVCHGKQYPAIIGEFYIPTTPDEEFRSKDPLQSLDMLADTGLGHMKTFGCFSETQTLGDR